MLCFFSHIVPFGIRGITFLCEIILWYYQAIELDGELLFDRAEEGRFPEVKEIKQMIRDKIAPEKDLGHSDIQEVEEIISDQIEKADDEEMDDDEAAEQRKFFGVM